MIVYFSGTGNGLYMAQKIGALLGDEILSIPELHRDKAKSQACIKQLTEGYKARLGIVFPIYAWNVPELVDAWLADFAIPKGTYIYAVGVCGENVGNTFKHLSKKLHAKGLYLSAAYSVVSPNNYIVVGKTDVDAKERQVKLFGEMEKQAQEIADAVKHKRADYYQVVKGPVPWLTTGLINPLFNRFGRSDKAFYADTRCTHCGLCERICPVKNIHLDEDEHLPKWRGHCTMCTACLHKCPVQAIQYGKATVGKGRYVHPGMKSIAKEYTQ